MAWFGLPVELFTAELDRQMQRRRPRREGDGILPPDHLRRHALHLIDVGPNRGHPIGSDRFIHPLLLVTVHRGGRQPDLIFKGFDPCKSRIVSKIHDDAPLTCLPGRSHALRS